MPKRIVPLSDMQVSKARPRSKQFTLFDGGGLFLLITPTGGKLWRFKYRFNGKERLLSLGAYPEISLADARSRRGEVRKLLAHGIDPGTHRKAQKQAEIAKTETFESLAGEWHTKFTPTWAPIHAETIFRALTDL